MPKARLPELVPFLARHALIGFALSGLVVALVAFLDIGGFRTLAAQSGSVFVAFPVLAFFLGLTLASVQMGAAIMLLPNERDRGGGSRRPVVASLQPVPVRVRARR